VHARHQETPDYPAPSAPVLWITGLSNAGKSTVAAALAELLLSRGVQPVILDGNQVRAALGVHGGFDLASRREMAFRYARLCQMLSAQGHTVICATISLFHDVHRWSRENIEQYFEVLLDVPLPELVARDRRGVYDDSGYVVGMGLPPEFPVSPDLVIRNDKNADPSDVAGRILNLAADAGAWPQLAVGRAV
jgi:cytidine diphosphoramidate kinase